ncbi:MAG: nickel-dependent hydrogenase large subunit [Rhodospirillales bacterium]|nr:nickel-dependent hydrogenase large subunit [Rhodospirillales bacterium]
MTRLIVGPFNRVEGDLEIRLEVEDGRVKEAFVNAPLFRDFEHLMQGRYPLDAMVIAPRICGICSVSQSAAALSALAASAGLAMPANGRTVLNLMQGLENAADHLVHFALFFMPDFARGCYESRPWHDLALSRFRANSGGLGAEAAQARSRLFRAMGILAGKWPHSLALTPGGSTKPVDAAERAGLMEILGEFRRFLETHLFGMPLEAVAGLADRAALAKGAGGDFKLFLAIADDLDLWNLGRSQATLMSFGAYPGPEDDAKLFAAGLWRDGQMLALDEAAIAEDVGRAWFQGSAPRHPAQGVTEPDADKDGAYSWSKAPRLAGRTAEVGALARQTMAGQPLILSLLAAHGSTVGTRVVARLVELARLVPAMEGWARAIDPRQPFCLPFPILASGQGVGMVEAARGSLGHWLSVENGRLAAYQVIAPTTWNFSPRDSMGVPGPAEAALQGVAVEGNAASPVAIQHVVRSFDPCMACTVH